MNLLQNGNFEQGLALGQQTHRVLLIPTAAGEEPHFIQQMNSDNPKHWTGWFVHDPGTWDQPEAHLIPEKLRIQDGTWAYHLFAFCRKMDAGSFQRVEIERPMHLLLQGWAHAWSNDAGHEHTDDPLWSEGPGFGPGFRVAGNYDAMWINFAFSLGIDPTGGINPLSETVRWWTSAHIYNVYHQIPPIALHVEPGYITVFFRARTSWPYKHNDAFFDHIRLTETLSPPPPPPPPRGSPRVPYARTYVLLPPRADRDWVFSVITACWNRHRWTLGGSADDAGIGDLDNRRVIAINPQGWPSNLRAFFEEHYPGIELLEIHAESPADLIRQLQELQHA